jgi:hypothetical protein
MNFLAKTIVSTTLFINLENSLFWVYDPIDQNLPIITELPSWRGYQDFLLIIEEVGIYTPSLHLGSLSQISSRKVKEHKKIYYPIPETDHRTGK